MNIHISYAEFDTILAALRYWQEKGMADAVDQTDFLQDIGSSGDNACLDIAGIDALCERINCDPALAPRTGERDDMTGHTESPEMARTTLSCYYLITVWREVSAEHMGPYVDEEARDIAAQAFFREEGDDYGIYTLDVTTLTGGAVEIEIGGYPYGFFEEDAAEEDAAEERADEEVLD